MNPILTQIIKAQDAYRETVSGWTDVDSTEALLAAEKMIKEAISRGQLATGLGGITDPRIADKLAIELQELGYNTGMVSGGQAQQPDGTIKNLWAVTINWKWMPGNSRDNYTV